MSTAVTFQLIGAGQGMSQRASNYLVIPLCPSHHTDGGKGVAIHAGQQSFEAIYGSELDLLAQTIGEAYACASGV